MRGSPHPHLNFDFYVSPREQGVSTVLLLLLLSSCHQNTSSPGRSILHRLNVIHAACTIATLRHLHAQPCRPYARLESSAAYHALQVPCACCRAELAFDNAITISSSFAEAAAARQSSDEVPPRSQAAAPTHHIDGILSAKYTSLPGLSSFTKEPQVPQAPALLFSLFMPTCCVLQAVQFSRRESSAADWVPVSAKMSQQLDAGIFICFCFCCC